MHYIQTPEMKALGLPFSAAVRAGDMLYLSGALGNLPGALKLAEGGMAGEARQAMENIRATLRFCGLDFDDVVKCTIMLADMAEWSAFNAIYVDYFKPGRLPARSAFGCNGLALGARPKSSASPDFREDQAPRNALTRTTDRRRADVAAFAAEIDHPARVEPAQRRGMGSPLRGRLSGLRYI